MAMRKCPHCLLSLPVRLASDGFWVTLSEELVFIERPLENSLRLCLLIRVARETYLDSGQKKKKS
jgi:hypothetical protein